MSIMSSSRFVAVTFPVPRSPYFMMTPRSTRFSFSASLLSDQIDRTLLLSDLVRDKKIFVVVGGGL